MNNHLERIKAVAVVVQLIAANPAEQRAALFVETVDDLLGELQALEHNLGEYPAHQARALELIGRYKAAESNPLPVTRLPPCPEENL